MTRENTPENTASKDYYTLLEVNPRAREEVIASAYEILSKECADKRTQQELKEAKDVLLDRKKRELYDESRNNLEGKVIGNYRIHELIAEGGFGKTYKAEHINTGGLVCLKHASFISPQDEEVLKEEAKAIWDLRHYSIPTMRDLMKLEDGSTAIVMSYIDGLTLENIVQKVKKLDPEDVCWITDRVLNALKYLHYHGVIHGDVKPENIIVQPETHMAVLVDYGLSAIRPIARTNCKGYTPYYASPEQVQGKTLIPESDFFSLGITMIRALGGDISAKKVPESVPEDLCKFIKRFLCYAPLERPSWEKEDLCQTLLELRKKVFGRTYSRLKKIDGM